MIWDLLGRHFLEQDYFPKTKMFEPQLKRSHQKLFRNHPDSGHVQIHIYAILFHIKLTLVQKPGGYAKAQGLVCFPISKTSARTQMVCLATILGFFPDKTITHGLESWESDTVRRTDFKEAMNLTNDTGHMQGQSNCADSNGLHRNSLAILFSQDYGITHDLYFIITQ